MKTSLAALLSAAIVAVACGGGEDTGGSSSSSSGAGAAGGGSSGTGTGAGNACSTAGDCPPSDACATYACEAGTCAGTFAPKGAPVTAGNVLGDCKELQCDGDGGVAEVDDDADVPNDYNPCTTEKCSGGDVTSTPVADGTACGTGLSTECQGGKCVGCKNADQCPEAGACQKVSCEKTTMTGVCVVTIDEGKEVSNSDPTDCFHAVCDKSGNIVSTPNVDETPPPDAQLCDVESCGPNGQIVHTPLADGDSCGTFCAPATCMNVSCMQEPKTASGTPTATQISGDCQEVQCDGSGGEMTVAADGDAPPDPTANDCVHPACSGGSPTTAPDAAGTPCVGGLNGVCDGNGGCT